MMSREQRAEAFKNYRIEIIDQKIYAVITLDYGREPNEVRIQDMYQRLETKESKPPSKTWWGTTLSADARFQERQQRLKELREFHK